MALNTNKHHLPGRPSYGHGVGYKGTPYTVWVQKDGLPNIDRTRSNQIWIKKDGIPDGKKVNLNQSRFGIRRFTQLVLTTPSFRQNSFGGFSRKPFSGSSCSCTSCGCH